MQGNGRMALGCLPTHTLGLLERQSDDAIPRNEVGAGLSLAVRRNARLNQGHSSENVVLLATGGSRQCRSQRLLSTVVGCHPHSPPTVPQHSENTYL